MTAKLVAISGTELEDGDRGDSAARRILVDALNNIEAIEFLALLVTTKGGEMVINHNHMPRGNGLWMARSLEANMIDGRNASEVVSGCEPLDDEPA